MVAQVTLHRFPTRKHSTR